VCIWHPSVHRELSADYFDGGRRTHTHRPVKRVRPLDMIGSFVARTEQRMGLV